MPFDGKLDTEAVQMLRTARDLIAKGWTKGSFERDKAYCLVGAYRNAYEIHRGQRYSLSNHPADNIFLPVLKSSLPLWSRLLMRLRYNGTAGALIIFNDRPRRTQADILGVLDRAILKMNQ